jgi:tetratricopeptide (TPR) repeat protein
MYLPDRILTNNMTGCSKWNKNVKMTVKTGLRGITMEKYKIADEKIVSGYRHIKNGEVEKACDAWLDAWEDIKAIMAEDNVRDIPELQKKYHWTEFLSNYVQDLELELNNAGFENRKYFQKRIKYCEEMVKVCGREERLIIENTRRAIADSHYELGNQKECDRLYDMWLHEDPTWGWGYIGWSDCYSFGFDKTKEDYEKAEKIIRKALEQKDLRDRLDVVMRAIEIYEVLDQKDKVKELKKEAISLERHRANKTVMKPPIKAIKIGRNEPCPCGSGKKYKKCCGK